MIRPPYLARVATGAAVYVIEESRKLPSTAVTLPMTALSQVLQTAMHFQQFVTSLAIKGDSVLSQWTGERHEIPEWATFDEDEIIADQPDTNGDTATGRFALYSMPPVAPAEDPNAADVPNGRVEEPEIAQYLDYGSLTLAQLRARLRSLSVEELTTLLDYEARTLARAPFQTMLENRIASAKAK
jgi:hypothetical protein